MIFSRTIDYALRIAIALAYRHDRPATTRDLAAETQVPPAYLTKVIRAISSAGIVHSTRGVGGGHHLTRPPSEITLLEVLHAVEDSNRIHSCPLECNPEDNQLCGLHTCIDEAIARIEDYFAAIPLSEFLENPRYLKFCPMRSKSGCNKKKKRKT
jgi:Rrf2 family protein